MKLENRELSEDQLRYLGIAFNELLNANNLKVLIQSNERLRDDIGLNPVITEDVLADLRQHPEAFDKLHSNILAESDLDAFYLNVGKLFAETYEHIRTSQFIDSQEISEKDLRAIGSGVTYLGLGLIHPEATDSENGIKRGTRFINNLQRNGLSATTTYFLDPLIAYDTLEKIFKSHIPSASIFTHESIGKLFMRTYNKILDEVKPTSGSGKAKWRGEGATQIGKEPDPKPPAASPTGDLDRTSYTS